MEWQEINSFALWIAATGTWFATLTALKLARRDSKSQLVIEADYGSKYPHPVENNRNIIIRATIIGRRPLRITGVFWKAYSFSFEDHPIVVDPNDIERLKNSSTIPISFKEGDSLELIFAIESFGDEFIDKRTSKLEGYFAIKSLKIIVEAAGNIYCESRPAKKLRQYLVLKHFKIRHKWMLKLI